MNKRLSAADRELLKKFYAMCSMIDIRMLSAKHYSVLGKKFKVDAQLNAAAINHVGNEKSALELFRYCEIAVYRCSLDDGEEAFANISGSFARVVERYPLLRGHYEAAQLGATWSGWWYPSR
jgi:hypothetical protein